MKILFIGMPFSVHTARWINQLNEVSFDIHLISSFPYSNVHSSLSNITIHDYLYSFNNPIENNRYRPIYPLEINCRNKAVKKITGQLFRLIGLEKSREETILRVIEKIKPDIIHTLETQHAGYQVAQIWERIKNKPIWVHSTWGIDLHLYRNFEEHISKIQSVLSNIDFLITEGKRDISLANDLGYKGKSEIIPSVGGGFNIPHNNFIQPSQREIILLKGTQDIIRRGLVGLRALERCSDILNNYKIVIYNCSNEVKTSAILIKKRGTLNIEIVDEISHFEMIELTKKARISITTNLSDGVPNSMIEAMLYGALPIQSNTADIEDWLFDGKNGFVVPSEDPDIIEIAIRRAAADDYLVDTAAEYNYQLIKNTLEYNLIKGKISSIYNNIIRIKNKN